MSVGIQAFTPDDGTAPADIGHRGGPVRRTMFPIDTGVPGLNLRCAAVGVDVRYSPRHHHCWDQVRFVLEGTSKFGAWDLEMGECAYFPEGTYYGPQDQKEEATIFVVQFPGPSNYYYPTHEELLAAADRLRAAGGVFEKGVYRTTRSNGRPLNKDGYEALWEACTGQELVYPEQRYKDPIVMRPKAFKWLADPKRSGVELKRLGAYNEYGTAFTLLRLASGADISHDTLDAPEIRYVLEGSAQYDGRDFPKGSCFWIPEGVPTTGMETCDGAELFVLTLPMFVKGRVSSPLAAAAAS